MAGPTPEQRSQLDDKIRAVREVEEISATVVDALCRQHGIDDSQITVRTDDSFELEDGSLFLFLGRCFICGAPLFEGDACLVDADATEYCCEKPGSENAKGNCYKDFWLAAPDWQEVPE